MTEEQILDAVAAWSNAPRESLSLATPLRAIAMDSLEFVDLVASVCPRRLSNLELAGVETIGDLLKAVG